jgi:hypothetical protein
MSLNQLLNYICAFILFFINTLTLLFELFCCLAHHLKTRASAVPSLTKLQATRSELLQQQVALSQRLADIDTVIASFQQSSIQPQQDLTQQNPAVASPHTTTTHLARHSTPPRQRRRTSTKPSSIGKPYPLPYTPPRTPEEERRNNIIAWINDLRQQNINNNGNGQ